MFKLKGSTALACMLLVCTARAQQPKAIQVLRHAQQAAGGVERLAAIRDITREYEMMEKATGAKASRTVEVIMPRTVRLTDHTEGGEISACFDGLSGWIKSPWGLEEMLPPWQRDAAEQELLRQPEKFLLSDRDGAQVEYVKSGKVGEKSTDVLDITTAAGAKVRLAIDSASGDILTLEYERIGPRGPVAKITDSFRDYRSTAGGARTPFKMSTLSDGQPYMETTVLKLEYNRGLRADVLRRHEPATIP
ncbi:MAG TPA: hypothetical protein VKR61_09560 [Bryobacteraceae bacterium]|nr:hypothetical protein [Bryobacteraceae bacterium]